MIAPLRAGVTQSDKEGEGMKHMERHYSQEQARTQASHAPSSHCYHYLLDGLDSKQGDSIQQRRESAQSGVSSPCLPGRDPQRKVRLSRTNETTPCADCLLNGNLKAG